MMIDRNEKGETIMNLKKGICLLLAGALGTGTILSGCSRKDSTEDAVSAKGGYIEEEMELSKHNLEGRVIVIDCITLWCTNFFFKHHDVQKTLDSIKAEFDKFTVQDATFIFVTNEIGLGGVSENEIQRKFTDVQGFANQYVASKADEVIFMVCGIPMKIK